MLDPRLLGLILVFAPLSLLSFGGGQAIMADVQLQTVEVHGWLTNREFTDLFAVSRAAPGPSTLIAALIGWHVATLPGAIVATLAMYVPSSLVVYGLGSWWTRNQGSAWRRAIERGLAPVAVGLIFAGAFAVLRATQIDALTLTATAVAGITLYFTKISPYAMMAVVSAGYTAAYYLLG